MFTENLRRAQKLFTSFTQAICAFLLAVLVINIFVAVLTRFVFFMPLNFSNQLSKYLVMWVTFLGSSLAIERGQHVAVEIFLNRVPVKIRSCFLILFNVFITFFFLLVIYYGFLFSLNAKMLGYRDPLIWHTNLIYAYLCVPVGFIFMTIQINLNTIIEIMSSKKKMP